MVCLYILFLLFFSSTWTWSLLISTVYTPLFHTGHLELNTLKQLRSMNSFPDQPCQPRIPAVKKRQRRTHMWSCSLHPHQHEAAQILLVFPTGLDWQLALYAPMLSCLVCNDFMFGRMNVSFLPLAEVKVRWTSHLCWTKCSNTYAAAVASVDSTEGTCHYFWNIFMVSEKIKHYL